MCCGCHIELCRGEEGRLPFRLQCALLKSLEVCLKVRNPFIEDFISSGGLETLMATLKWDPQAFQAYGIRQVREAPSHIGYAIACTAALVLLLIAGNLLEKLLLRPGAPWRLPNTRALVKERNGREPPSHASSRHGADQAAGAADLIARSERPFSLEPGFLPAPKCSARTKHSFSLAVQLFSCHSRDKTAHHHPCLINCCEDLHGGRR